jgi:membrane-associated phospholipid phosphatase
MSSLPTSAAYGEATVHDGDHTAVPGNAAHARGDLRRGMPALFSSHKDRPWHRSHDASLTPGPTIIDNGLRQLSQAANKSRLWLVIAAAAALFPGRSRRAALRGIGSLAVTSAVANGLLKPLIRRRRPDAERTPLIRRLKREPITTSFPSGHAASAAAFTTGVAMESLTLGAAMAPLAGAVAYSRVHVGVHHVSDVLAGAALGAGFAVAGHRWWPVHPRTPSRVRVTSSAPPACRCR